MPLALTTERTPSRRDDAHQDLYTVVDGCLRVLVKVARAIDASVGVDTDTESCKCLGGFRPYPPSERTPDAVLI
jgi:hypothetical protein